MISPAIRLSYLICATPRTGSNFLCELLRSTGVAGQPDDYFWNPPFWYQQWGVSDFASYFQRILQEGMSPNGVFGSKMMWGYLAELIPQLAQLLDTTDTPTATVLGSAFPNVRYLWLTRQDKVRQGISFYRALESKVWRSTDIPSPELENPRFNFSAIDSLVQLSIDEDDSWREYFRQHAVSPFTIVYEELARAPSDVVQQILAWLGLPAAKLPVHPWRHQRQADGLTDEWAERYHRIKGSRGEPYV